MGIVCVAVLCEHPDPFYLAFTRPERRYSIGHRQPIRPSADDVSDCPRTVCAEYAGGTGEENSRQQQMDSRTFRLYGVKHYLVEFSRYLTSEMHSIRGYIRDGARCAHGALSTRVGADTT